MTQALLVGVFATFLMDFVAIAVGRAGLLTLGPYRIVPALLGRWILSRGEGGFKSEGILDVPPKAGEVPTGWLAHYGIGAFLGSVFVMTLLPPSSASPQHLEVIGFALLFGGLTCLLPWCLMYPLMGFGFFASRTTKKAELLVFSTFNHFVFGLGLALGQVLLSS